jgi:hypothetical protein
LCDFDSFFLFVFCFLFVFFLFSFCLFFSFSLLQITTFSPIDLTVSPLYVAPISIDRKNAVTPRRNAQVERWMAEAG